MADITTLLQAVVLGIVEGVTEFLPVSSTGHLILADYLLGFTSPAGKVFEVVIQFGAILAICVLYFDRLLRVVLRLPYDPGARRFAISVAVAFLPAMVLGAILHDWIKEVLFSPWVVVCSLVVGGVAILVIEGMHPRERLHDAEALPLGTSLAVGFCQVLAMIPGVSRSGATILGGVLLGVDRKAAAEFSFFLAIPTMMGATVLDLWKARSDLHASDLLVIAVGFVVAMVTAIVVVRAFVRFIQTNTFRVFGWYRIAAGLVMAVVLLLTHRP